MKSRKVPSFTGPLTALLQLALLMGVATASGPAGAVQMTDGQRNQLKAVAPEARVYTLPLPRPLKAPSVSAEAQIQSGAHERVRLLQSNVPIEGDTAFQATVTRAHAALITFSNTYSIGLRLPEGHGIALSEGQKVAVEYTPVTTQGALESVLTVSDDVKDGRGALILQVVQRGGADRVAIRTHDFTVGQTMAETPMLETAADRTSRVEAVVQVTGVQKPISLIEGKSTGFEAGGRKYVITLVKSLHVVNLAEHLSVEGPPYYLEYVVTRAPR